MTVCLSLFISINYLTILSSIAIAGGLYLFFAGFQLLARKRLLLTTPTSKIRSAALGLVEVTGAAAGPYTISAPITGKPCFLYHTTAWQQRDGKKRNGRKLRMKLCTCPSSSTTPPASCSSNLSEPISTCTATFAKNMRRRFFSSNLDDVPPRVSVFLSRHGVVPGRRLRIEERCDQARRRALHRRNSHGKSRRPSASVFTARRRPHERAAHATRAIPRPTIFRSGCLPRRSSDLPAGAAPSTTQEMGQQEKIAAALTRAGITKPEAWSAAGVPYQTVAVEENEPPATGSANAQPCVPDATLPEERLSEQPGQVIRLQFHSARRIDERR